MGKELKIDLTVVCSNGEGFEQVRSSHYKLKAINIEREIAPFKDIISIINLYHYFREERFDIVHSTTPKAGLLVMIASFLARSPVRIHYFTGQRWITLKGLKRNLLIFCDKITGALSTNSLCDSHGQRMFLIKNNIISPSKIKCISKGSVTGVDLDKFNYKELVGINRKKVSKTRENIGLAEKDIVISFLGRVVRDKGITELVEAFELLDRKNVKLLIIGPREQHLDPIPESLIVNIEQNPNVFEIGMVSNPEDYLACSDIFCLPSYREGFPTVMLEASSLKLPIVAFDVYGVNEAVLDNETGLLVKLQNVKELKLSLLRLIDDEDFSKKLGETGFQRVIKYYTLKYVTENLITEYEANLKND
jgi:glycosyltransferase involved in cell wall biosynthesis